VAGSDLRGTVLDGRYEVIEPIAEGAMGAVYRGERVKLGRAVAIKVMHEELPDELSSRQRFEREAKLMARLEHPNCVSVIDFGLHEDKPFLVMDLVRGTSLLELLDRAGKLEPRRAGDILRQVLSGLAHAHELGIVHRDIKPANIMISEKAGLGEQVQILDFGLARLTEGSTKLTTGIVVGTPNYMAPEQCRGGTLDARTDLYACGVLLFEMLIGEKPFYGEDPLTVVRKHLTEPPRRLGDVDPATDFGELEGVVSRALAKNAADRFGSAVEMARAIEDAVGKLTKVSAAAVFARAVPAADLPAGGLVATPSGWNVPQSAVMAASAPSGSTPPVIPAPAPVQAAEPAAPAVPAALPPLPQPGPYVPPPPPFVPSSPPPSAPAAPASSPPIAAPSAAPPIAAPPAAAPPAAAPPAAAPPAAAPPAAAPPAAAPPAAAPPVAAPPPAALGGAANAAPEAPLVVPPTRPSTVPPAPASTPGGLPQLPFTRRQLMIGAGGLFALVLVIAIAVSSGGSSRPARPSKPTATRPTTTQPAQPRPEPAAAMVTRAGDLIAYSDFEGAITLLVKARKQYPDNAELAYLAGRAYFGKLWWADGIKQFRDAIALDPILRKDPELLKTVLKGFLTTPSVDTRIADFMHEELGAAMRPYLEETASTHPTPKLRARAKAELSRYP
jgi:eukaryotic-like serine/threonine-protein kinase